MAPQNRDSGFTMIELLVTISLLVIMMAIAISGWTSWAKASSQSGTARELQSVMRQAQVRAVTEGRAICVSFRVAQNDYTVYRGACDDTTKVRCSVPSSPTPPTCTWHPPDVHRHLGRVHGRHLQRSGHGVARIGPAHACRLQQDVHPDRGRTDRPCLAQLGLAAAATTASRWSRSSWPSASSWSWRRHYCRSWSRASRPRARRGPSARPRACSRASWTGCATCRSTSPRRRDGHKDVLDYYFPGVGASPALRPRAPSPASTSPQRSTARAMSGRRQRPGVPTSRQPGPSTVR